MTETLSLVTMFVPLFLIVWLANLAQARRERDEPYGGLLVVAYVFLAGLYALGLVGGLALQVAGALVASNPEILASMGSDFSLASLPLLAIGLWLPSLLGMVLLLPAVRRLIARFTALDAEHPVHAVALSLSMLVLINLFVTLGIGLGNLADMMATTEAAAESNTMLTLWIQQILTAILAMVGVGWLTRRSWRETLARLGLTMPTGRQWLIGIGAGLAMVPVVLFVEWLASFLGLGADADVERLSEQLLGSLFTTPLGILTIGLSAGLGEETLFRGALLPRFGIVLTSVFFALVHSNYGITLSTLVVLILGMVLGLLRLRYNTSTAMITHAVYNMTLGLLAYLSASWLDF